MSDKICYSGRIRAKRLVRQVRKKVTIVVWVEETFPLFFSITFLKTIFICSFFSNLELFKIKKILKFIACIGFN